MKISLYNILFSLFPVGARVVVAEAFDNPVLFSGMVCELLGASSPKLVELYGRTVNCITMYQNQLYIMIGD